MKGLELCENFYKTYGKPMIEEQFREVKDRIAAGVFGWGSECWGYDDAYSRDHDFEPRFYLLLDDASEREFGFRLMRAYDRLVREHGGSTRRSLYASHRGGVREIGDFFEELIGGRRPPEEDREWMCIPDYALSAATNGKIFSDPTGKITSFRNALLARPEEIRSKKLSALVATLAQTGQYNVPRCMARGETAAAQVAASDFVRAAARTYLLAERVFSPHDKWIFRALRERAGGKERAAALEAILRTEGQEQQERIEAVCKDIADVLREQGLSDLDGTDLEAHAVRMAERLRSPYLKGMHLLEGAD